MSEKGGFNRYSKHLIVLLSVLFLVVVSSGLVSAEDRLIVKNGASATTFRVEDTGRTTASNIYRTQSAFPGFWLDETGMGMFGLYFVLDNSTFQLQRRPQGFGTTNLGAPFRMKVTAPADSIVIDADGDVGFGVGLAAVDYPIEVGNGAYLTTGGVWTNGSSRELKENIEPLASDNALKTLKALDPVTFSYKAEKGEQYVGFIAEDVPELVASKDRKGLSAMDIVATLTKVVQEQQKSIEQLEKKISALEAK
jgi:hypothetical protein